LKRQRLPLLLSGSILLLQALPVLSPVRNPETLLPVHGFSLHLPLWHLIFTPFASFADYLTVLNLYHLIAIVVFMMAGIVFVFKRWISRFSGLLVLVLFLLWGAFAPRPMARLVPEHPDDLLIDFHSHTSYSHDGRPTYKPRKNMQWHHAQGYAAGFITDHNRIDGAVEAQEISRQSWQNEGYRALKGEEVSLHNAHMIVLGVTKHIDHRLHDGDPLKIEPFIKEMRNQGMVVIASLPEYWEHHWGEGVRNFIRWGISGFEIISSAPKALTFPQPLRREVISLAREHNLAITGISDSHGYGSATAAWNVMRLPGWQSMGPDALEKAVLHELKSKGFRSVAVLERQKSYWRTLQPLQAISWTLWIWGVWFLRKLIYG